MSFRDRNCYFCRGSYRTPWVFWVDSDPISPRKHYAHKSCYEAAHELEVTP